MGDPEAHPGTQHAVLMTATPNFQPLFQLHACLSLQPQLPAGTAGPLNPLTSWPAQPSTPLGSFVLDLACQAWFPAQERGLAVLFT